MEAESNNWNEREGNKQHGLDQQVKMEQENKISGRKRCEYIHTLCTNNIDLFTY